MDKGTNKKISDFVTRIDANYDGLIKAYLFGSYAKKSDRPTSDIDLALIFNNIDDSNRFDLQVKLMMVASDYDLRIEPHPISQDSFNMQNPFAAEILKSGIEIEPDKPYKWFGEVL